MTAYYNENDAYCAQWLRNLIAAGHIAPGDVDERDIRGVQSAELRGYTQVHLFAGIGVWSYALRQGGWGDDRCVWTGSCPCQPFSTAGRRLGTADERHLWPEMFRLIRECQPITVFGEQVGSALAWLDLVCTDLETEGYTVGAVDTCAAGYGAPHIRQRLWWVADSLMPGNRGRGYGHESSNTRQVQVEGSSAPTNGVADATKGRRPRGNGASKHVQRFGPNAPSGSFWSSADWLLCRDGKARPVEPGTFPLAHRPANRVGRLRARNGTRLTVSHRVGRLRGYGNAIVAPQAAAFVKAYMEARPKEPEAQGRLIR